MVRFAGRYDHFIGGDYVPPADGGYFGNPSPVTGEVFTEVAESTRADLDHAWYAARGAAASWSKTSAAERAVILTEIADRIEDNIEALAVAETWETGKPVRETLGADLPLASDHFRFFAGAIRAQEGALAEVDGDVVVHGIREPVGTVALDIPWDFPLLAAAWRLAPALAAGNTVVLKPASQTPASVHVLLGVIADLVPPGVMNVVNGCTVTTQGSRGPAVFFDDVAERPDAFRDRALTGFATGTSQAIVHHGRYEQFLDAALGHVEALVTGHPLDPATMVGALVSTDEVAKALAHIDNAVRSGARLRVGGTRAALPGELSGGFYVEPTVVEGYQQRVPVVGQVISVIGFNDFDDAVKLVNETPCTGGVSVWSRDTGAGYRAGRAIQASRVWVNDDHAYPAEAAFGRENRHGLLAKYWREKRLLVNYG